MMDDRQRKAHAESVRKWAKNHPDKRREINRRYRDRHRDELRERLRRAWASKTEEERRAISKRRYALYRERIASDGEYAERRREQNRASSRKWAANHKAECAARHKEYAQRNRERLNEYARKRRAKNPERYRQTQRKWREAHREELLRKRRENRAKNIQVARAMDRKAEQRRKLRKMMDAEYYQRRLSATRMTHAKATMAKGKAYRPRFHMRSPAWATMGIGLDCASPWLVENITPEMRAYAKELFAERRTK